MQRASKFTAGAFALLAWLAPNGAAAVNVTGTSVGLSWVAATGPVKGYAVQVSRNGSAFKEEARVTKTSTRVAGVIGETVRVRTVAYDGTGRMGAPSTPSDFVTFTQATTPPPPPPPPATGNPSGDVDGDGMTDAFAYNAKTGEVSVLLVKSNGTRVWQTLGAPTEPGMRPVGFADVDGDGQADLLWRDAASGANELWRMNGSNYTAVALPDEPASFRVRAFRDFSGDGKADAFFHDAKTGASEIWTLGAAGRAAVLAVDPAPSGTSLAAIADVDADGKPDLVWETNSSGALEGWRMNGATPSATFSLPDAPAGSTPAGAGDLDGDGADDLVWLVKTGKSRSLNVWFMDGMNAPAQGIAVTVNKKTLMRGVADVNSDGRADLVLLSKAGFTAYGVSASGTANAAGDMVWNTQPIALDEVPANKRWYFLVLE